MDDLTRRILDTIAAPDYPPITAKALAKRLKIDEDGLRRASARPSSR